MASSRKPAPADLQARVHGFLASRILPGARLCLGYSGGLDSTVLLHLLAGLRPELGFALAAVHVHHGLSAHADDWAAACRSTCARLGVPIEVARVQVLADGTGVEAAARAARYEVFARQQADFILLAHHADDQAETLLLRLFRGSGVHGLSAMAEERMLADARVLRPLLDVPRRTLESYARRHGLAHVEDESNADPSLTRNWLRGEILPALEARFPACRATLAGTAERLSESAELLDDLARLDLADSGRLAVARLAALPPARARNLLRYWLRQQTGLTPSARQLDTMLDQMLNAGRDRQPACHWAGHVLSRYRGHLRLGAERPEAGGEWRWRGEPELQLGEAGRLLFLPSVGDGLSGDVLSTGDVLVRWRAGGEKLKPDCRRPRRTLKNLLREAGLAPEARRELPLLLVAGELACVPGVGVDCRFQAAAGEPGWLISWRPRG